MPGTSKEIQGVIQWDGKGNYTQNADVTLAGRLELSAVSKRRFAEHALRLFEREQGQSDCLALLGAYVRRRRRMASAGLRRHSSLAKSLLGTTSESACRYFKVIYP
jgi:hypothetical protein